MEVVNLALIKSPLNWLTIAVWLFALGFIVTILDPYLPQPAK